MRGLVAKIRSKPAFSNQTRTPFFRTLALLANAQHAAALGRGDPEQDCAGGVRRGHPRRSSARGCAGDPQEKGAHGAKTPCSSSRLKPHAPRVHDSAQPTPGWEFAKGRGLCAVKFHVHDKTAETEVVWAISCVHDSDFDGTLAKGFIEKMTMLTDPLRGTPEWRTGGALSAQTSFAPVLQQRLEQANSMGRTALLSEQVDYVKNLMHENIELILQRGEDLEALENKTDALSTLARNFKSQATRARRFQMWQHAKFGAVVGGAVTAGVAIVVVPAVVAAL